MILKLEHKKGRDFVYEVAPIENEEFEKIITTATENNGLYLPIGDTHTIIPTKFLNDCIITLIK